MQLNMGLFHSGYLDLARPQPDTYEDWRDRYIASGSEYDLIKMLDCVR